jgi:hypothetical protein
VFERFQFVMILAEGNQSSASDQWCEDVFQGDKVAHNWSHIDWDWFNGKQVLGKDNWHTVWYRLMLFKTMYETIVNRIEGSCVEFAEHFL